MRTAFRYALTTIATVLIGLAIFTVETVVDEAGYTAAVRRLVQNGWSAVIDAGYADWILWGTVFFLGAALALWFDYGLRKLRERPPPASTRAAIAFRAGPDWRNPIDVIHTDNIFSWRYTAQSGLDFCIVFDSEVADGYIGVITTSRDMKWVEEQLTDRALIITLSGTLHKR